MYLASSSPAALRFFASIKDGRGLKPSARDAGINKGIGYRWLREMVLVHGLWHQPAHFDPLTSVLRRRGFTVHVPRLHRGSLRADTRAVQSIVDRCVAPPVVVGHSYGGSVITGLTGISHLVFVAAFVPANGESSASLGGLGALVNSAVLKHGDGSTSIDPDRAIPALYGHCHASDAEHARRLLVTQAPGHGRGVPETLSWTFTPSTYVICEDDNALDPELQGRMSKRCTTIVRLPSDHSPFICQPEELANALITAISDSTRLSFPSDTAPAPLLDA